MATTPQIASPVTPIPEIAAHEVPRRQRSWVSWLTTTDHKRIGIMYLVASWIFFAIGGVEALIMRLQLSQADNTLVTPQTYNTLVTMHGTTMVFLFMVPMIAGIGSYLVPLMIGAREMAFPRLNALSFWLFIAGGVVFYGSLLWSPAECGWTCYAPLSEAGYSPTGGVDAWIFLIQLTGIASFIGALNFFVTISNMRAPGMGWGRLPLFCWAMLTQAILLIITIPVIGAAVTLLLTDRHFGTHFFDPTNGGSPLLWQNLFWFFAHPQTYLLLLPVFGIVSEILPVFARKPIFGRRSIVKAMFAIGGLSLLIWIQDMFTAPLPFGLRLAVSLLALLVVIPIAVTVLNWVFTLWRGSIHFDTPMYFAAGFIATFLCGVCSAVLLAVLPVNWQLADTYFAVANYHYMIVSGALLGLVAGLYYWFPKMSGRMLNERLGKMSFWFILIGFWVTFLVQHSAGLSGMPRRVYEYSNLGNLEVYNLISTIGSFILAVGILMTIVNFVRSLKKGAVAGADPWKANTLEWFATSPPPVNNFDVIPHVHSVEPMKDIRLQIERQSQTGEMAGTGAGRSDGS